MTSPKISVVIPFFDEFAYLEACLGSVLAAGDAVLEVILINDQPTPKNSQFLDALDGIPKVRVLHNDTNIGAFATRNVGIVQAIGTYLLFLDADDMLSPAGLKDLLEFAEGSMADLVYLPTLRYDPKRGHTERFYRDRMLFGKRATKLTVQSNPELRYGVANWSVLLRRSFVEAEALGFDSEQRRAADHLFILSAVEAATNIATFDQWIHIWRNRGGSITTKKAGVSDFNMQLSTLRKNAQFMEQKYSIHSIDFQRDFAFVFMRFIWNWTFFQGCIPARQSSAEARDLLSELTELMSSYPIDPKVFSDVVLRRALPAKTWSTEGKLLSNQQIIEIYDATVSGDWPTVGSLMGLAKDRENDLPANPCAASQDILFAPNLRIYTDPQCTYMTYDATALAEFGQVLTDTSPQSAVILLSDPSPGIWEVYKNRLNDPEINERRRFSEYFLDEIDVEIAKVAQILQSARDRGCKLALFAAAPGFEHKAFDRIGVSVRTSAGEFNPDIIEQTANLLRSFAERAGSTYEHALADLAEGIAEAKGRLDINDQTSQQRIDTARNLTFSYALSEWSSAVSDVYILGPSIPGVTRGELSLHWMAVEAQGQEDLWVEAILGQIEGADATRFGDANSAGLRTFASKLKYRLSSVKTALTK